MWTVWERGWAEFWVGLDSCVHNDSHVCAMLSHFSRVQLFATPWTVACQVPLSIRFSRQEYWTGLPFPPPGDLPNPGIEPTSVTSTCIDRKIFYPYYHQGNQIAKSDTGLFSVSKQVKKGFLLWADLLEKHTYSSSIQLYRCRTWWAEDMFVWRERCHRLWAGRHSASQDSGPLLLLSHVAPGSTHIKGVSCLTGLPRWCGGKESTWQCRRYKRHRFHPWVGEIPWRRKWQPTPGFLPGEFHGQRSLVGLQSTGSPRVRHNWTGAHTHTHTHIHMLLCRSHQCDIQWQQESELQNHTEIYPLRVTANPKQSASPFHDSCGCESVMTMRITSAETLRESESCSVSLVLDPLELSWQFVG